MVLYTPGDDESRRSREEDLLQALFGGLGARVEEEPEEDLDEEEEEEEDFDADPEDGAEEAEDDEEDYSDGEGTDDDTDWFGCRAEEEREVELLLALGPASRDGLREPGFDPRALAELGFAPSTFDAEAAWLIAGRYDLLRWAARLRAQVDAGIVAEADVLPEIAYLLHCAAWPRKLELLRLWCQSLRDRFRPVCGAPFSVARYWMTAEDGPQVMERMLAELKEVLAATLRHAGEPELVRIQQAEARRWNQLVLEGRGRVIGEILREVRGIR